MSAPPLPVKLGCPRRSIYQTMGEVERYVQQRLEKAQNIMCDVECDSPIAITRLFLGMAVVVVIRLSSLIKRIKEYSKNSPSSRMSYGRFLDYLEMGWVKQVDLMIMVVML